MNGWTGRQVSQQAGGLAGWRELTDWPGADLGGGCRGCAPPPPEMKLSSLYILISFHNFFISLSVMSFLRGAPLLRNPGSTPADWLLHLPYCLIFVTKIHGNTLFTDNNMICISYSYRAIQKDKKRKENWSKGITNKNDKLSKPRLVYLDSHISTDIFYSQVFNPFTPSKIYWR